MCDDSITYIHQTYSAISKWRSRNSVDQLKENKGMKTQRCRFGAASSIHLNLDDDDGTTTNHGDAGCQHCQLKFTGDVWWSGFPSCGQC